MYDLVIKDFDGPIIDSVRTELLPGVHNVCREANVPDQKLPTLEDFYWGYEPEWELWYKGLGADFSVPEIRKHYRARADNARAPLAPDVRGFLDLLTFWRIPRAIVSHHDSTLLRARLAREELSDYFGYVWGGFADKAEKIREACQYHGTTPDRALLIGDTNAELYGAEDAGCDVAIVIYDPTRSYLLKRRPKYYACSYWELAKKLGLI